MHTYVEQTVLYLLTGNTKDVQTNLVGSASDVILHLCLLMQIPFESDDDGSGEASGSEQDKNQDFREAPDDIIFDESADETSEETSDLLTAEGSSDVLVTENSVSESESISVDNTAAIAGEDSVSMEDVAALSEEGDGSEAAGSTGQGRDGLHRRTE